MTTATIDYTEAPAADLVGYRLREEAKTLRERLEAETAETARQARARAALRLEEVGAQPQIALDRLTASIVDAALGEDDPAPIDLDGVPELQAAELLAGRLRDELANRHDEALAPLSEHPDWPQLAALEDRVAQLPPLPRPPGHDMPDPHQRRGAHFAAKGAARNRLDHLAPAMSGADLIRTAATDALWPWSVREIRDALNENGVPLPVGRGKWTVDSVVAVLDEEQD